MKWKWLNCPRFSWDRVNFHKKLAGLTQTANPMRYSIPVMSRSVFKWGAGWRRGFCYSGASWASGGENTACCICFVSVLFIGVFFSLCHSAKLFSSHPRSFCLFFFLNLLLTPPERGKEWESNCVVLCCKLRQNHNTKEIFKARVYDSYMWKIFIFLIAGHLQNYKYRETRLKTVLRLTR